MTNLSRTVDLLSKILLHLMIQTYQKETKEVDVLEKQLLT